MPSNYDKALNKRNWGFDRIPQQAGAAIVAVAAGGAGETYIHSLESQQGPRK